MSLEAGLLIVQLVCIEAKKRMGSVIAPIVIFSVAGGVIFL
jgi:hypothetical protein